MFEMVPFRRRKNEMQNQDSDIFNLDRVFENFMNDSVFPSFYTHSGFMKVDIKEEDDAFILEAELPGVRKENISIDINEGRLTLSVESDERKEEKNERYVRRERRVGMMRRSFNINDVDADKISAKLEDGLLSMRLPKLEKGKPSGRKVAIE